MSINILTMKKEMFDFSKYSTQSKYYDDPNKLVVGKMKAENGSVPTEEFFLILAKDVFAFGR